jgi:hypothetical protein
MPFTFKPQYRWRECGEFMELQQTLDNVLTMPPRNTWVAVWNDFENRYEYGWSTGHKIERVWDSDHLPEPFKAGLLLVGLS